jgi:hypothetical protein
VFDEVLRVGEEVVEGRLTGEDDEGLGLEGCWVRVTA